jgi:membrane protein DedA with SNARE-associated domain
MVFLALIAGTLVSEDLACISAGLLIRDGRIGFAVGAGACALGILLGDVGLWAVGRVSRSVIARWPFMCRFMVRLPVQDMRMWLDEHAALAMLASRFMPGTRLPLYLSAGIVEMSFRHFATWATVAVLLWTPVLVWLAATTSGVVLEGLPSSGLAGWIIRLVFAVCLVLVLNRAGRRLARSRAFTARLARWARWEFWPMWLFYAPVALWVFWLSIRYRGISTITASNPGIPDGGVVGESKWQILSRLPAKWTVASELVDVGPVRDRARRVLELADEHGWRFPIILKPDVGQRGVGVRLARRAADVETYCAVESAAVIVQPYHPGPFEAGVFYYRLPGDARGRILSITDKHFPQLVGDGTSTVEELIWSHRRYRLQADTFLRRHADVRNRVLARGEVFQLTIAGNHAQGTLFRDGWHLWTPALERRIDAIAQAYPGFFIGRFDVRYTSREAFQAGEDLAIVELNGATAESTDIYDPQRSLCAAYRRLFTQWSLVFAIGAANRDAGAPVSGIRRLLRLLRSYAQTRPAFLLSD